MSKQLKHDLEKLTEAQRKIMNKHFVYLSNLDEMIENMSGQLKRDMLTYKQSVIIQMAAMMDMFEKRNALVEKGYL